jgi:DNA-binding response OmpR family regulator
VPAAKSYLSTALRQSLLRPPVTGTLPVDDNTAGCPSRATVMPPETVMNMPEKTSGAAAKSARILLVDDDPKLCRLVTDYLPPFGFDATCAHTGPDGLRKALEGGFQAVILDCMLPGLDGFEVLKQLRRSSNVPVLMLTALGDESDRIVGLELGADDYLPKTFSSRELLARLRAVTRRSAITADQAEDVPADHIVVSELEINGAARKAWLRGQLLTLTALEFDLLWYLAHSAGRVMSRDRLLELIAGRDYEVFDRSIDVHISALRRKLGDDARNPRYIRTVRSAGYMFMRNGED